MISVTQAPSLQIGTSALLATRAAELRANEEAGGAVAYREFVDDGGTVWRVWDTHPVAANTLRTVSPTYAGGWLTFESDAERRRLAPIPPEWELASRDLMGHWCARAAQARPWPSADPAAQASRAPLSNSDR